MFIDDTTPIAALTVSDFKELLKTSIPGIVANEKKDMLPKRYVYGLRGIEKLFGVSHKTAQLYKDTFLAPAVMQNGRKIVVDADLAMELFNQRKNN